MGESFVADCPVCQRRIVVHNLTASCGACGVATSATDARETWPNVEDL
jgi:uncharacterized Fe-S radical SAM superfamily protein PflX